MALKTLALLLAATGVAVALYKRREQPALESDDASDTLQAGATPNLGEQLQDMKLANAGLGSMADADHEDLLSPPRGDEQQSEAIKPGLPDFARGA